MNDRINFLFDVITALETQEECERFFEDLLTPEELRVIANRWCVAALLHSGYTQRDVLERLGISSATASRVNRFLRLGTAYRRMIEKLQTLGNFRRFWEKNELSE